MPLIVNSNIPSLNAQRNLTNSVSSMAKSLERLSSGMRINRAGDDAAGLAISETLRAQVRGLDQAARNANDGLSLIGTAEGALNETVNILQRIRELAVQAASDTNSSENRATLQSEVDQLVSEMTRIGNTVQFNGKNLLDGTFNDQTLQIGAFANQTMSFSLTDMRATALGATADVTGTEATDELAAGDLVINGIDIGATTTAMDAVSTQDAASSAISVAYAINAQSGSTGVKATVGEATWTGSAAGDITAINLGGSGATNTLKINGEFIVATVVADDVGGALVDAINAKTNTTGVTAELDGNKDLVLTADDGRNIAIDATAAAATALKIGVGALDETTDIKRGTVNLQSDATIGVSGTNVAYAGLTAGSTVVDTDTAIFSVDVTTAAGAASAITHVDYALGQVNDARAEMGALTNRLESTISNLRATAENLSASESQIRDADFAAETASLIRSQILQQAGVSVLAQANITPQAALALLG
jgi:flagellin